MITERLLIYGLKNSKLHNVLTVANGLACDCKYANFGLTRPNSSNKFPHHQPFTKGLAD